MIYAPGVRYNPCSRIIAYHASFCSRLFDDILGLYVNATRKVEVIYSTGGSDIVHLIVNDTVFTVNRPKLERIFSTVIRLLPCIARGSVGLLRLFVSLIPCYHGFVCERFTVLQDVGAI